MGTWGAGIYANDIAEEVRDACKEIFAFYDVVKGNELLLDNFSDVLNQGLIDNEYASFWYALADWQWKHGMLTECVREKAMELLNADAGIQEWAENKCDFAKRKKTLALLREQLQTPQPPMKKPKLHLAKPKHKPGDIVIFRATDYRDEWDSTWNIRNFRPPYIFQSAEIAASKWEDVEGYDAHGKYMAILCVGSEKRPYSMYLPDAFDEYSAYVWYHYLSDVRPSVEQLNSCGFLPMIDCKVKDYKPLETEYISWIYRFILTSESFKSDCYTEILEVIRHNTGEADRFHQLLSYKSYSKDYVWEVGLCEAFFSAFEEVNRADLLGFPIDDLLHTEQSNPEFLPLDKIDEIRKRQIQGLT